MTCSWTPVTLGSSGLVACPLGLGSSYGVAATDVERAVERGVNYLYWGSLRSRAFAAATRSPAVQRRREKMVLVVQSYARAPSLLAMSVASALRTLKTDYADVLLLGWWNNVPPERLLDAARTLRQRGRVRHIMVSGHHRPSLARIASLADVDALMVRYSAAHVGAEVDLFPHLPASRPGVVAYTATRWGSLINPRAVPAGEAIPRASDCYRFALSHPSVDVCLAGPKNGAELDEALRALDRGPLSDEENAWMRRVGAHVHAHPPPRLGTALMNVADRIVSPFSSPLSRTRSGKS